MRRKKQMDNNGFDEWGGYMNAKITKLEEQFDENATNCFKKSDLFAGISIFVNGLTDPSSDELKRIMLAHGGVYHTYRRSNTTFIIASNLPDVKIRQFTGTNNSKILSPQWIVDCLKEEKIVDYSKYILYSNCTSNQRKITDFHTESVEDDLTDEMDSKEKIMEDDTVNNIELKDEIDCKENIIQDDFASKNIDLRDEMDSKEIIKKNDTASKSIDISKELDFLNKKMQDLDYTEFESNNQSKRNIESAIHAEKRGSKQFACSAVDSNFLTEFYNNSRLHHISTLGARFKEYTSELREKHDGKFAGRDELLSLKHNVAIESDIKPAIMHIDMDCFFVSVGLRSRPQLRGFPVAVTHSKGGSHANNDKSLSEIASCSYEARQMGLKNGMFVGTALKLCPDLKTIPYDFDQYKEVALTLYDTIAKYTLDIEAVSCDEMYVDLGDVLRATGINVMDFVSFVRDEIKTKTHCPCSAGIGANRLQARMATKKAKPNGQFELQENEVEEYFLNIEISDLPGVGYSITKKLNQLNWKTCADLREISLTRIQQEVGTKLGMTLHQYCRGIDTKPLVFDHIRKSVSTEVNYGIRFTQQSELETFLKQLCTEVHNRLCEIKRRGKSITLKYMVRADEAPIETAKFMGHGLCDHVTKTITLNDFTDNLDVIVRTVMSIQTQLSVPPADLRGIGIQITKLDVIDDNGKDKNQLKSLFEKAAEKQLQKKEKSASPTAIERDKEIIAESRSNERVLRPTNNQAKKVVENSTRTRGRGRGRGRGTATRVTRSATGTRNTNLFTKTERIAESEFEDLDMNVLAELPDEIREEILRDHKAITKKPKKVDGVSKKKKEEDEIDAEFLAALPPDIRKEVLQQQRANSKAIEKYVKPSTAAEKHTSPNSSSEIKKPTPQPTSVIPKKLSESNILGTKNWRNIVKSWLDSTNDPLKEDIDIFANYASELIELNMLNQLYLALRCLFRLISELDSCNWHSTYFEIIKLIQQSMLSKYKSKLQVETKFNCDCARFE